jgi:hypothetical protein
MNRHLRQNAAQSKHPLPSHPGASADFALSRRRLLTTIFPASIGCAAGLAFLLGNNAALAAAIGDDPLEDQVAAKAQNILDTLRHTNYQHHSVIDPATGTYDCDCAEFVGYILQQLAPANYRLIPKEENHVRPRAFKYYEYFHSLPDRSPGWRPLHKISSLRPGDIIAWRAPDIIKDEDTGHVMIVAGRPQPSGRGLVTVRVFDSSGIPHVNDSRGQNKAGFRSGVGEGGIVFRIDAEDRPTAFQFRPPDHFHEDSIAMARIEPIA